MNREQLFVIHAELTQEALELMEKKNKDYAGNNSPFANFERVQHLGICSPEQGFLVRMADKLSRLSTYANVGKFEVSDEGVKDTLIDMINYSVLLYAYIESKKEKQ